MQSQKSEHWKSDDVNELLLSPYRYENGILFLKKRPCILEIYIEIFTIEMI